MKNTLFLMLLMIANIVHADTPQKRVPNVFNGYNYYSKGKLEYRSTPNKFNSKNFYNKKSKLEYRGYQFGKSETFNGALPPILDK